MIRYTLSDGVATISLDAPGKNAMSIDDMTTMLSILEKDGSSWSGLILTGENQSFCSGLMLHGNQFDVAFPLLDKILVTLYTLPCPVVCAMRGHAIGAGFLMMCCADVVYSTDSMRAKYGLPEVKIDLGIDALMTEVLEERLDHKQLNQLLFTGEYILCDTMLRWGVVDKAFADDAEMMAAANLFIQNAAPHLRSYGFSKRLVRAKRSARLRELLANECYQAFLQIL